MILTQALPTDSCQQRQTPRPFCCRFNQLAANVFKATTNFVKSAADRRGHLDLCQMQFMLNVGLGVVPELLHHLSAVRQQLTRTRINQLVFLFDADRWD